jgi:hypothetical protein
VLLAQAAIKRNNIKIGFSVILVLLTCKWKRVVSETCGFVCCDNGKKKVLININKYNETTAKNLYDSVLKSFTCTGG